MIGLGLSIAGGSAVEASSQGNRNTPAFSNTKSLFLDGTGDTFAPGFTNAEKQAFFRDSFTISFWATFNHNNNFWSVIGADTSSGGARTSLLMRELNFGGGNLWYIEGRFNEQSWNTGFFANGLTGDKTTWVHIAMVMQKGASSSDNNTFKLYQNGVLLKEIAATTNANMSATSWPTNVDLTFGALSTTTSTSQHGEMKLDEVAFFDTALDAYNVVAIYNSGSTFDLTSANGNYRKQANLIRYYRLEDNLTDSTGTTDGATVGDPSFDSNTPDS